MDIEQVHQFIQVTRDGSVSAAAKHLHVSQSALSRSLVRLEDELGSPLFERTRNSMKLNEVGRAALPYAEELLGSARHLHDAVAEATQRGRMLRLGSIAPAPLWYATSLIVDALPDTMLSTETFDTEGDLEQDFLSGRLDVAIATREIPGSAAAPLMREDLFLWVPVEHPLAKKESVTCDDFVGETFLVYGNIGIWWRIHEQTMPHSMIIRQYDRDVWIGLMLSSHALGFTTNAPRVLPTTGAAAGAAQAVERVAVPVDDERYHTVFYLCVHADAAGDGSGTHGVLSAGGGHAHGTTGASSDEPSLEQQVLEQARQHPWNLDGTAKPAV